MHVDDRYWNKTETRPVQKNQYGLRRFTDEANMSNDRAMINIFSKYHRFTTFKEGQRAPSYTENNKRRRPATAGARPAPPTFNNPNDVQEKSILEKFNKFSKNSNFKSFLRAEYVFEHENSYDFHVF